MKILIPAVLAACVTVCACSPAPSPGSSPGVATKAVEPVVVPPSPAPDASQSVEPVAGRMTAPPVVATTNDGAGDADQAMNASIDAVLGDHTIYRAAIQTLQAAVAAGDAAKVAGMTDYPITVEIGGVKTAIADEKSFIKKYGEFMTPEISSAITKAQYGELMANSKGVMFGNGEAWINGICKDAACAEVQVKLVALQSAPN